MSEFVYNRDSKKPIYFSTSVMRWLWLIAKSHGGPVDELAEAMVCDAIQKQYPSVIQGLKKLDALEKEIIDDLQKHEIETCNAQPQ